MKPPRLLLGIELFEDRLLPSSSLLDNLNAATAFPSYTSDITTPWHYRSATVGTAGTESNTLNNFSIHHNSNGNASDQVTTDDDSSVISAPANDANSFVDTQSLGESNVFGHYQVATNINYDSATAESTAPASLNQALNENTTPNPNFTFEPIIIVVSFKISFSEPRSVIDPQDGRLPAWFNRDGQLSTTDLLNAPVNPDSSADVRSDLTAPSNAYSDSPPDTAATVPPVASEPAPAVSTPTPGVFLASLSPQLNAGTPLSFEQPASTTESHFQSDMKLAAISLMGNQGVSSITTLPLLPTYSTPVTASNLPAITMSRSSLNLKVPAQIKLVEVTKDLASTLTPIEVNVPSGEPIPGVIGLNAIELDERVSRVLSSMTGLGADIALEFEQPDSYTWLIAAGLLSVGAGYTAWINRKSQRVVRLSKVRRSLGSWEGKI